MLLDAGQVHIRLQWLGDTLILLRARCFTADSATGSLGDILANTGDLAHGNPDRIRHSFDAFRILGRGLDGFEQFAYVDPLEIFIPLRPA